MIITPSKKNVNYHTYMQYLTLGDPPPPAARMKSLQHNLINLDRNYKAPKKLREHANMQSLPPFFIIPLLPFNK